MKRLVVLAGALVAALLVVGMGAGRAAAQKGKGAPQVLGVSFELLITEQERGQLPRDTLLITGRINVTSEAELRLRLRNPDVDAALIMTGGRIYLRFSEAEGWEYLDMADLLTAAGRQSAASQAQRRACGAALARQAAGRVAVMPGEGGRLLTVDSQHGGVLENVPVTVTAGRLNVRNVVRVVATALVAESSCGVSAADVAALMAGLETADLPDIRWELAVGTEDGFPRGFRADLENEDSRLTISILLQPSTEFFTIMPPATARPLDPAGLPGAASLPTR